MNSRLVKTAGSVLIAVAVIAGRITLREMRREERAEEGAAQVAAEQAAQQASAARKPIVNDEPPTPASVPLARAPIAAATAAAAAANARTAQTNQTAQTGDTAGTLPAPAAVAAATPAEPRAAGRPSTARTGRSVSVSVDGSGTEPEAAELTLVRETFSYAGQGRRDPFVSLMENGDLRPTFGELRLVGVAYDPTGRGSVAIMRDIGTKEQYRVRVGQALGRMRVARIQQKQVLFTIEEFGFSRQEVLALGDSTTARVK